jgi:hypothetical protein
MSAYENALQQWRAGEGRLAGAPPERRRVLDRVVEQIYNELRRRLGGAFTVAELVALYDQGAAWAIDIAVRAAPEAPWAWEAATVTDAAFARYLREASDYGGGRTGDSRG